MHKVKAILDAFTASLTMAAITAFQSRERPADVNDTPCVFVNMGNEERTYDTYFVNCNLNVDLILKVTTEKNTIDNDLLLLRGQVENQIQSSKEFGIDYVIEVQLREVSEPQIHVNGDMSVATITMTYLVNYRYEPTSPLM